MFNSRYFSARYWLARYWRHGIAVAGVLGPYCFGPTVATSATHAVMAQSATHVLSIAGAQHAGLAQTATHVLSVSAATHAVKAGCDCE